MGQRLVLVVYYGVTWWIGGGRLVLVVCHGVTWWISEGQVDVGGVLWCGMVTWWGRGWH